MPSSNAVAQYNSATASKTKHEKVYEIEEVADKLAGGVETFLVWMDLVGNASAKEKASRVFPLILQTFPTLKAAESSSEDGVLDYKARIMLAIGDLCLDYNVLSHKGARDCLAVAMGELPNTWTRKHNAISSGEIRYDMALGIMIAKLSCRLKFSKDYKAKSKKQEETFAKELKKLKM